MDDLTPVTRTERLLDGEDLTPTNREEMFIKRIYDKTQEIPEPVNRKEYFLKKAGEAGGDVTVVPLSVTANGTYTAPTGKAYTPVNVAVDGYALKALATPSEVASFNAAELPLNKLKIAINAVQSGSGEPSPTNIRPISGWDAAKVSDVGKNLYHGAVNKGCWNDGANIRVDVMSTRLITNAIKVIQGEKYTFTFPTTFKMASMFYYDSPVLENGTIYNNQIISVEETSGIKTFTALRTSYAYFYFAPVNASQTVTEADLVNAQMEKGERSTTYEPYNGVTITISLGQTVYGGELDVVNGVLRITDGYIASYNGETLPSTWISSMDVYAEGTTPTTGAEVCYELATPTTVSLTPTLIKSLNGTNNIYSDTGEVMECEWLEAL